MRFTIFSIIFSLFTSSNLYAQDLNAYKYVMVPKKFDFQKKEDQYQLNSLTKFLFNKKGITTLMDDEKQPDELYNNPCLGLKAKVLENSNLFTTKLAIQLLDCRDGVVYTSEEGRSKIKDLKKGHHDALRKAFQSIQTLDYSFDRSITVAMNKEVESEKPINERNEEIVEVVEEDATSIEKEKPGEVQRPSSISKDERVKVNDASDEDVPFATIEDSTKNVLYSQEINNGFQLVDNTPKIVFKALKSLHNPNLYYLENKAGILYKKDDIWYAEYYRDGMLVVEKLTIKF